MKNLNVFNAIGFHNGDGAKEAAYQAERQFIENDFDKNELKESLSQSDNDFNEMAYKDDDGFWRITGKEIKFDTYEKLIEYVGHEI